MNPYFRFFTHPDGIAELILDREGEKVNLLQTPMMAALKDLLDTLGRERSLKALIIKSAKRDNFIAGADIHEIAGISSEQEAAGQSQAGQDIMTQIEQLPFPTISVIDGACLGGGLELALACTFRVVSDNPKTKLGLPEVTLGIMPGFGGTYRLPRLIGLSQALPIILSGRPVDGAQARRIKLADALFPSGILEEKAAEFAARLIREGGKGWAGRKRIPRGNPLGSAITLWLAQRRLPKKMRDFYPASLAALQVIRRTYGAPLQAALEAERQAFSKLAVSAVSKNLTRVFLAAEAAKKSTMPGQIREKTNPVHSVAVLGAGVMGGDIAWLASSVDLPVRMKDLTWEAVGNGHAAVCRNYKALVKHKKLTELEAEKKRRLVTGTVDDSGFSGSDFVIEAIVEVPAAKMQAYRELENLVRPDAIIATNTSSLSVSELAEPLKHPERFVGFHFFNPVSRMPLVEIIPGKKTSPETLGRAFDFARQLNKTPILVGDCHGFLVNRILMAYLNESLLMLSEGFSFTYIDQQLADFGMPLGPFELLDEIGIPVALKVAKILSEAYPERSQMAPLVDVIGGSRWVGRATGSGFYLYAGKKKSVNPAMRKMLQSQPGATAAGRGADDVLARALLRMINEAAFCLEEGIVEKAESLDLAMILGTGFPAFRGGILKYADDWGISTVLERLARYETLYGNRFKPSGLLKDLGLRYGRFYP